MAKTRSKSRARVPNPEVESLLRELEASELSVAQFARERGISPWRLYESRRKAEKPKPRRKTSRRSTASAFVPVELTAVSAQSAPLELVLSSGHRLRIPSDFDETALRRLMGVLASC